MTPLRVVHVSQPVEAGVAAVVRDLVLEQRAAGLDVRLISPEGPLAAWARREQVQWLPWAASREPGRAVPAETWQLRRLLTRCAPDVLHLHSSKAGLAGRLAVRGRVPTAFQPHAWSFSAASGVQGRAALSWERAAARWTHLLLLCSPEEEREGVTGGLRARSLVVPNGVDVERFALPTEEDRAAARDRLGLSSRAPVALCVGRLSPQKGQDLGVRAWRQVRRERPDALLLLVGDGPDRAVLERDAGNGVLVLGHRDDVPDLVAAADLALLPSRWEGLALSLLEAMAGGLSVVTTDVAGSRSTLLGGDLPPAGEVVPVGDAAALAQAVLHRFADPQQAAAEGRAGRLRVEQHHDVRSTTAQVRQAYALLRARP